MHALTKSAFAAVAFLSMASQPAAAQSEAGPSPLQGSWKLDAAASKFASGPGIREETRVYEINGDKVTLKSTGADASGKPFEYSYSAAYDGKFYPMMGNPTADSIALTRVDARRTEATVKKGDEITGQGTLVVSADGKNLAFTRTRQRTGGEPAVDQMSYVKQD